MMDGVSCEVGLDRSLVEVSEISEISETGSGKNGVRCWFLMRAHLSAAQRGRVRG